MNELVSELMQLVGPDHVLTDEQLRSSYECDWTGRFSGRASAVVRPADTAEVATVVAACARRGVPIVPQGGNTGLVGGAVPRDGAILLSLRRLDRLGPVDVLGGQVTVGAGVTLSRLQEHAHQAGFDAGLDFGARDAATAGGIAATDAGGARAWRYGTARARIVGVEAVFSDGRVIRRVSGLQKDNAGYSLPALLVGSEGTLAIITEVRWRLVPAARVRAGALVPLPSIDDAVLLFTRLRAELPQLTAADFFLDDGLELVRRRLGLDRPVQAGEVYLLAECGDSTPPVDVLVGALTDAGIEDAAVASDVDELERLWRYRDGLAEAVAAIGVPRKLDVGVPLTRLAEFVAAVPRTLEVVDRHARVILFGHVGDGNVHVNVLDASVPGESIDEAVLRLTAAFGGTISAEHGIGVAKTQWLELVRSAEEIELMRALKRALDPMGLLNPGVILGASDLDKKVKNEQAERALSEWS